MINKTDAAFEAARARLLAVWEGGVLDRPAMLIPVPIRPGTPPGTEPPNPEDPQDLRSYYMDPERVLRRKVLGMENTRYLGDALPVLFPYWGTAGHVKYFRDVRYRFGRDTIWFEHTHPDLAATPPVYDPDSPALADEIAMLAYFSRESRGRFFVAMPDNCGMLDGVAAIAGNEPMMLDMLQRPRVITDAVDRVTDGYCRSLPRLFAAIDNAPWGGHVQGWMGTYSHGPHMQLQVDCSVMLSPGQFEAFALPALRASAACAGRAIYHLDGQEQIRHLDMILSVPEIRIIQWTAVAGQPRPLHFLPVLRRIQAAGRGLLLMLEADEVEAALTGLSSRGLQINVSGVRDEMEAERLLRMGERLCHD